MQVSLFNTYLNKKQQSFQSRNPEIRFADEIMRRVNHEFPLISATKFKDRFQKLSESMDVPSKYWHYIKGLGSRNERLRDLRASCDTNPFGYLHDVMTDVEKHRIGNCGELATIGKAALVSNGLPALKATLCVYKGDVRYGILDHSFDIVNTCGFPLMTRSVFMGKNSYIFDLWKGFIDYSSNAFRVYETEFGNALRPDEDGIKKTLGISLRDDFQMDKRAIKFVQEEYPTLIIN